MDCLRYENKYFISEAGYQMTKSRLSAVIEPDVHMTKPDHRYFIRSLYFDDYLQSGLLDKQEGIEKREKFRLRFYDMDDRFIRLEAKQKIGMMTSKKSARLTREEADRLLVGDIWWMFKSEDPFLKNFYLKARTRLIKPAVIVDYYREAFIYRDVRITFDRNVRSGLFRTDLFSSDISTVPVIPSDRSILEVKYDEALPDHIRRILTGVPLTRCSFSKYEYCRALQSD